MTKLHIPAAKRETTQHHLITTINKHTLVVILCDAQQSAVLTRMFPMNQTQFSDDEYDVDEIRPAMSTMSTTPHKHDIIMGSMQHHQKKSSTAVSPMTRLISYPDDDDDDELDEYGYPIIKSLGDIGNYDDDDDDDSVSDNKRVGNVGFKWRVRVLRVNDSEEQWKGVCEIYFHWNADDSVNKTNSNGGVRKRLRRKKILTEKEKHTIVNIDQPEKCPIFIILNEEDSNSIEEMYYTMPGHPDVMFGYLAWTIAVHERLELEVSIQLRWHDGYSE
jgi:hypothetical protein